MDAELFLVTKTVRGSSSGAAPIQPLHCSFFLLRNNINRKKRAIRFFASLPSPPHAAAAKLSPSDPLLCKLCELSSTNTAFGERNRKIYTARDVALGLIDVFGWSVEADGKGEVGKVADILHIGRSGAGEDSRTTPYEYLLKVVRPFSNGEESGEGSSTMGFLNHNDQFTENEFKILIPIVNEFMEHIDPVKKRLLVKPPAGLLELAARPELIAKLRPEIRLFCKRYAKFLEERFCGKKKFRSAGSAYHQDIVYSYMPTREQMFAVGRADLVRRVKEAGGFLYVANVLGLKSTRRPNGFWDDLQRLDFEIECFLLESWVKHVHKETGGVYFKNPISNKVTSEKPANVMNGKSLPVPHDVRSSQRVMPRMKLLGKAGRWDLHHAIVWNGGYREVSRLLGRRMVRRSKKAKSVVLR